MAWPESNFRFVSSSVGGRRARRRYSPPPFYTCCLPPATLHPRHATHFIYDLSASISRGTKKRRDANQLTSLWKIYFSYRDEKAHFHFLRCIISNASNRLPFRSAVTDFPTTIEANALFDFSRIDVERFDSKIYLHFSYLSRFTRLVQSSCRIDNCYCFEQLEEDFTNRVNHTTVVWFWKRWTRERRRNTFRNLLRKPINFESNHARLVRFVVHANRSDSYRVSFETLIIGVVPIRIDCLTAHIHTAFLWIIQYTVSGPVHRVSPLPSLFAPCPYITEESFYSSRVIIINKRPTGVF